MKLNQPVYIMLDHNDDEADHVLGYFQAWVDVQDYWSRDIIKMGVVRLSIAAEGMLYREHGLPSSPIRYEVVYSMHIVPAPYYVNVYEVDRQYGGPEEGGWWYDTGHVVYTKKFDNENEADAHKDTLSDRFPNNGDYTSMAYSGGDYRIFIENEPGKDYPEHTPFYE